MEITSFNQIFVEAARLGLRLNNFSQLPSGVFRCNWRRAQPRLHPERDPDNVFYDAVEHERPFDAMLAAFRKAEASTPTAAPEVSIDVDLFA